MVDVSGIWGAFGSGIRPIFYTNDSNLRGLWRLEESDNASSYKDYSLHGNDLSRNNNIFQSDDSPDPWSNAGAFFGDSTTSYLFIADTDQTGLEPTTEDFSFGGWFRFKVTATGSDQELISKFTTGSADRQYSLRFIPDSDATFPNALAFALHGNTDADATDSGLGIAPNRWYHIVAVKEGSGGGVGSSQMRVLLNGVRVCDVRAGTVPSTIVAGNDDVRIGIRSGDTLPFGGDADEVFFFLGKALSDAEVFNIMHAGIAPAQASGIWGGYLRSITDFVSGIWGGYTEAEAAQEASGIWGGYSQGLIRASGFWGGYLESIDNQPSGFWGGYTQSKVIVSGTWGGLTLGIDQTSGVWGGFCQGALQGNFIFDAGFIVEAFGSTDFNSFIEIQKENFADFNAKIEVFQPEQKPDFLIIIPENHVSGVLVPYNQYFIASGTALQGKKITKVTFDFGDLSAVQEVSVSGGSFYPISHSFAQSGFYIVVARAIDSEGVWASDSLRLNLASGVSPITMTLEANPIQGIAPLDVTFTKTLISVPSDVTITKQLLKFGNNHFTADTDVTVYYTYNTLGCFVPVWLVRDSRGFIFSDTIEDSIDIDL